MNKVFGSLVSLFIFAGCSVELQDANSKEAQPTGSQSQLHLEGDFVVSGTVALTESILSYRRLVFLENSVLLTNGGDFEIRVEEIVAAPNSRIMAFENAAPGGQPGKSAGRLRISANLVSGELGVHLIGQAGGPGASGLPYDERAATGVSPTVGIGSLVGDCNQTIAGGKGSNGAAGRDGLQGALGGDGGVVELFVNQESHNNFRVRVDGGVGGVGGIGGDGQLGGLGGDSQPGRIRKGTDVFGNDIYEICTPKPNLGEGETGPRGRDGQKGPDGKVGTTSFQP